MNPISWLLLVGCIVAIVLQLTIPDKIWTRIVSIVLLAVFIAVLVMGGRLPLN